jgi:hypothetical protein
MGNEWVRGLGAGALYTVLSSASHQLHSIAASDCREYAFCPNVLTGRTKSD